jgi:hypothetical protein
MNEARVVDFSGIERKEEVNRVSKLSTWSDYFRGPYQSCGQNGQLKPLPISVVRHTISCCGK